MAKRRFIAATHTSGKTELLMSDSSDDTKTVDDILKAIRGGDSEAVNELMPFVYDELRRQARNMMKRERQGHTLQTTALVHEVYVSLVNSPSRNWENQEHFFNVAAKVMRNILVGHARRKHRLKRGGGHMPEKIELDELPDINKDEVLIRVDEALDQLQRVNKRQAEIVESRFFAGLTNEEIAKLMNISETTVKREWRHAKTWLRREINDEVS